MIVHVDKASIDFLLAAGAPITPIVLKYGTSLRAEKSKYVVLDMDVFPMDNSGTKKEGVSYTYKGFNGYAPLAAYLGEEGWCLACELRPGSQHGQKEFISPQLASFPRRATAKRSSREFGGNPRAVQYTSTIAAAIEVNRNHTPAARRRGCLPSCRRRASPRRGNDVVVSL